MWLACHGFGSCWYAHIIDAIDFAYIVSKMSHDFHFVISSFMHSTNNAILFYSTNKRNNNSNNTRKKNLISKKITKCNKMYKFFVVEQ